MKGLFHIIRKQSNARECLLFLLILLLTSLLCLHTVRPSQALYYIRHNGYWYIGSIVIIYGVIVYQKLAQEIQKGFLKKIFHKQGLLSVSLLIACFLFTRCVDKTEFKIVSDEPLLAATAFSMYKARQVYIPTRAHTLYTEYAILQGFVDKRPYLFPFLVCTLHDFTGYRIQNSFILNGILSFVFLMLTFSLGYRINGHLGGRLAIIMFAAVPIYIQAFHSGGFELLNVTLILATLLCAINWLKHPQAVNANLLCLSGVLLSQVRYESILYIIPIVIVILLGWWNNKRISFSWGMYLTPLLLVPCVWHKFVFEMNPDFWEMTSRLNVKSPFSLDLISQNWGHAINFFFGIDFKLPNNLWIALIGIIGLVLFFIQYIRSFSKIKQQTIVHSSSCLFTCFTIFCLGFFLNGLLLLGYAFGQLDDPILYRFSLPFYIPLIFGVIYLIQGTENLFLKKGLILSILLSIPLLTFPKLAYGTYGTSGPFTREHAWVLKKAQSMSQDGHNALVITDMGYTWALAGVDNMTHGWALLTKDRLLAYMNSPQKPEIYVQQISYYDSEALTYKTSPWRPDLSPDFDLELIDSISYNPITRIEFFRLKNITGIEYTPLGTMDREAYLKNIFYNLP